MNNLRFILRTVDFDKQRLDNVEKLKKLIPNLEVFIDTKKDGYNSFFEVCKIINDTGAVILEDDIELCGNFVNLITSIINDKGFDKVYNFFEKPKSYFETSYVGGSNFLWMQCIYLPKDLPLKIFSYYDEFKTNKPKKWQGMATDCLIQYALTKEKIKYWRIRPCLVQHLDFKSVIGNRPTNRQSPYYIELLKEKGINYNDLSIT